MEIMFLDQFSMENRMVTSILAHSAVFTPNLAFISPALYRRRTDYRALARGAKGWRRERSSTVRAPCRALENDSFCPRSASPMASMILGSMGREPMREVPPHAPPPPFLALSAVHVL